MTTDVASSADALARRNAAKSSTNVVTADDGMPDDRIVENNIRQNIWASQAFLCNTGALLVDAMKRAHICNQPILTASVAPHEAVHAPAQNTRNE
jgi:hypothetical protein